MRFEPAADDFEVLRLELDVVVEERDDVCHGARQTLVSLPDEPGLAPHDLDGEGVGARELERRRPGIHDEHTVGRLGLICERRQQPLDVTRAVLRRDDHVNRQ
jgi:hypothetical protein